MASKGNDPDAKYALSRLLQRGTVAEYQKEFEILISRVTGKSDSLLASIYIYGLKPALIHALLRSNPVTLDEAFSLARAAEARFTDLQLWEFLRSYPLTLGEAFFRAGITEARFEDKNNQVVETNVSDQEDPDATDKQEVKNADDQEIKNIQDEEDKNVEDQQVSDDDTNIDYFGCSLPHHKGADLTVKEIGANKDSNPNDVFNDVGGVGDSKADGTWVPAMRIDDDWHLFDELGSKLYIEDSIKKRSSIK
ncbi:hypothetical protein Tco_0810791 [Tanacetum coccineum]